MPFKGIQFLNCESSLCAVYNIMLTNLANDLSKNINAKCKQVVSEIVFTHW